MLMLFLFKFARRFSPAFKRLQSIVLKVKCEVKGEGGLRETSEIVAPRHRETNGKRSLNGEETCALSKGPPALV
jgi:hypothetical protein